MDSTPGSIRGDFCIEVRVDPLRPCLAGGCGTDARHLSMLPYHTVLISCRPTTLY
jgi:hypothetical protein